MFGMRAPKKSDNTKYYTSLGVEKSASADEIKKAYRKAAMKNHPDKGGDPELFKEISQAYDVLSDPEKKQMYDEYGEDALKEGGGGGGGGVNPFDIFEQMFGGGGGGRGRGGRRKGEDVAHPLKITLENLYNGTSKKLSLQKNVICSKCTGSGSKSGKSTTCGGCRGQGIRIVVRQVGPGMIQQMQTTCPECRGSGQAVSDKDKCPQCRGDKVVQETKIIEVNVEKGMQHNQKLVFEGEADESPDTTPGDIVFVLQQKEHPVFKRSGNDLIIEKELLLSEALCGYKFVVTHLDNRQLVVASRPHEIVKPGAWKAVAGEGMPTPGRPFDKGRLFIHFSIKFPAAGELSDMAIDHLAKLLPPPSPLADLAMGDESGVEEVSAVDVDMEAELRQKQQQQEEEEEAQGGGRRACAQQ